MEDTQRRTVVLNKVRCIDKEREQPPIARIGGCYLYNPISFLEKKILSHNVEVEIPMFYSLSGNNHTIGVRGDDKNGIMVFDPNCLMTNKPVTLEKYISEGVSQASIMQVCDSVEHVSFTKLRLYTLKAHADGHFAHKFGSIDEKKFILIYKQFKYIKSLEQINKNINIKRLEDELDKIIGENNKLANKLYEAVAKSVDESYDNDDKEYRSYVTDLYSKIPMSYMAQSYDDYKMFENSIKRCKREDQALYKSYLTLATDCISGNNLLYTAFTYIDGKLNEYMHTRLTTPYSLLSYFKNNDYSKFENIDKINNVALSIVTSGSIYELKLMIDAYGVDNLLKKEMGRRGSTIINMIQYCLVQQNKIVIFLLKNYKKNVLNILQVSSIKSMMEQYKIKKGINKHGFDLHSILSNLEEDDTQNEFNKYVSNYKLEKGFEITKRAIELVQRMEEHYSAMAKNAWVFDEKETIKKEIWKRLKFHLIFGRLNYSGEFIINDMKPICSTNSKSMNELKNFCVQNNIVAYEQDINEERGVIKLIATFLYFFKIIDHEYYLKIYGE